MLKRVTALLIGFLLPFLVLKDWRKLTMWVWRGKLKIFNELYIFPRLFEISHFLIILHARWLIIVSGMGTPASLQINEFLGIGTKF